MQMPWRSVNSWYAQIRKHGETWDTIQAEILPSTAQGRERPTGGTVETGDPSEGNSPADDEGVTHEGDEEDEFATAERLEEEDDVEANLEPLNQDVSALDENEGFEGDKPTSDELQGFDIAVQADFEAIVEFLVSGDADEGGEEDVWPLLERRVSALCGSRRLIGLSDSPHLARLSDCSFLVRIPRPACRSHHERGRAEMQPPAGRSRLSPVTMSECLQAHHSRRLRRFVHKCASCRFMFV